ncbi:MAG: alpha/beta hydrolase [bacterium]
MKVIKKPNQILGTVQTVRVKSEHLKDNPWGDPSVRDMPIYLPPGYASSDKKYPVCYYLAGYTNSGPGKVSWQSFSENLVQRIDRLIRENKMGEVIVVFPDCFTTLGGNQYIDSKGVGRYASYIIEELIPFVDDHYHTLADRKHRAVLGKSSGGYGSFMFGMKYSQYFNAIASHSGDAGFEAVFGVELPVMLTRLSKYESIESFLRTFWSTEKVNGNDIHLLMMLGMAASFDPLENQFPPIQLPVNRETSTRIQERWKCWLQHDPVTLIEQQSVQNNISQLDLFYFDCGRYDQYNIHYGNRILAKTLEKLNLDHIYREFIGTHSNTDSQYDVSLPLIYKAIKPAE